MILRVLACLLLAHPLAAQQLPERRAVRDLPFAIDPASNTTGLGVTVSAGGITAVLETREQRVAFYAADGKRLGTFGRSGEGPGEFRHMVSAGWVGDSLWVTDQMLRRVTLIGPDRKLVRAWPIPVSVTLPGAEVVTLSAVAGVLADGSMLVIAGPRGRRTLSPTLQEFQARAVERVVHVTRVGPTEAHGTLLGSGGPSRCMALYSVNGGYGATPIPLCQRPEVGVAPDGRHVATLTVADPFTRFSTAQLELIPARGGSRMARTIPVPSVPLAADTIMRRLEDQAGGAASMSPVSADTRRRAVRAVGVPQQFPAFSELLVGRDGTIWVQAWSEGKGARRWSVYAADGSVIGTVLVPELLNVKAVDRNTIWGVEIDADGVEQAVRYRVVG